MYLTTIESSSSTKLGGVLQFDGTALWHNTMCKIRSHLKLLDWCIIFNLFFQEVGIIYAVAEPQLDSK